MRPVTVSRLAMGLAALLCALLAAGQPPARAASYSKITGAGSTWSSNALDQWRRNVASNLGMTVNFAATGSSNGREQFKNGTADFAVSEIPYGLKEGGVTDSPPTHAYAYMPIVAGGTAFMYNLRIGGKRVTNLRLSGEVLAKIFTSEITRWNAPEIKADNPGLTLPGRAIIPVVRSDGSGTSAQFTTWLAKEHASAWNDFCRRAGKATPCGMTSYFPNVPGSSQIAKSGSLGVSGYVRQDHAEGAITYVEYSYAIKSGFPVAKMLNRSGYYVEPTASSVAVGLMGARINTDTGSSNYLTQILDGVYRSGDRRTYPLSSYSYMIVPTTLDGAKNPLTRAKGATLGAFANYFLCDGQQQAEELGYSPLPKNLVQAGFDQVRRIPGAPTGKVDINGCRNPTFSSDGSNTLAKNAPYPKDCDKKGTTQCETGTAGAKNQTTPVSQNATGGSGGGQSTGGTGGSATGGSGGQGGTGTSGGSADSDGDGTPDAQESSATADSAGASGGVVDPDTGEVIDDGTSGDSSVVASPVSLAADDALGLRGALMILSALLLVGVVVGPPLTARALAARSGRRKGDLT
ncbi:phosphate ABC transporter substrate-binding protein PstS [Streptomyces sp. NBC_00059]|uniref:phosphate ABC transporter substrate-binding protein PstS n=1 Tax=Streptomyces sp. NBC_00059 TaxID=2975635 RepID=UPI00224E9BD8|nr:phosphate ABC transporter substrate-binding protein PstS [Streptomyces sp. NBC_00059]MCX5410513.1 phosphate ABC transporter substrate-binding protein PstS [Streptomyces sp. NBC_00059]